jgi:hypothetical protein
MSSPGITLDHTFGPLGATLQPVAQAVSTIVAEKFGSVTPIVAPIVCSFWNS